MPTDYSNVIVESFAKSSSINYKLENVNGKLNLNKTIDDAQPQYVEIGTIVGIDMNILVLFNTNESIDLNSYDFSSDLMNKNVILFTFAKEGMYISMGTLKLSNGSTDKTQELANTSNKQLYYSYEKLCYQKLILVLLLVIKQLLEIIWIILIFLYIKKFSFNITYWNSLYSY